MNDYWSRDRELRFNRIEAEATGFGLKAMEANKEQKPWGGFVRFERDSLDAFRRAYWQRGISPYWKAIPGESWHHDDPASPSTEDAVLRCADDYGRVGEENHERDE